MPLGGTELTSVHSTLQETDPNKFGNSADLELQWAMKAYHHAETYFNLIRSVDPRLLKLTRLDDEIYEDFRKTFPNLKIDVLNEEEMKSPEGKAKWHEFCMKYNQRVEDFNMGTLIRVRTNEEFSEQNSTLVVRIQFLAIEIARNREGFNDRLGKAKSETS